MNALSVDNLRYVALTMKRAGVFVEGDLTADLIAGGRSNLTFLLRDQESRWVLRMPPLAGRTPSAHDVAREFRVTSALSGTAVPVPAPRLFSGEDSPLGVPFTVADFVEGRTIQSRRDLDALDEKALSLVVDQLVGVLVELHRVDYVSVGLGQFGKPDGYAARQVNRWRGQWEIVGTDRLDGPATTLADGLAASIPPQRAASIVHGDFRIDNTLLDLTGDPRVAAVLDWELSTIGDPNADVAMMCAYRHPAFDLIMGAPSAWTSPRLPDVSTLSGAYEAAAGLPLEHWEFQLALAYFKVAVIAAGIDHRFKAGSGEGPGFSTAGEAVEPLLEAGLAAMIGVPG